MSVDNVLLAAAGLLNSGSGGGGGASGGDRPLPIGSAGKYVGYNSSGTGVAITPDSTPTDGSNKLVTSDGVFDALAAKQDKLTFDPAPTENSPNALTSGAVYAAIAAIPSGGGGGGGIFIANYNDDGSGGYTCDKTVTEILAAISNGYSVFAKYNDYCYGLSSYYSTNYGKAVFFSRAESISNTMWVISHALANGGNVSFWVKSYPLTGGLSNDAKEALLALLEKVAYIDENGEEYYGNLEDALYGTTTTGITAVFSPGQTEFITTDTLESLRQYLTVTLNKSNGTSKPVSDYTLSGTLTRGTSVITVAYRTYTTTFNVNVTGEVLMWQGYSAGGTDINTSIKYPPNDTGANLPYILFTNPSVISTLHEVPYVVGSPITSFELEVVTAGTYHVGKLDASTYCVGDQSTVVPLSAITNIETFNLSTGFQKVTFSEPVYLAEGEVLCFGLPGDTIRHRWVSTQGGSAPQDRGFGVRDCVNQATWETFWNLGQSIGINVYRG